MKTISTAITTILLLAITVFTGMQVVSPALQPKLGGVIQNCTVSQSAMPVGNHNALSIIPSSTGSIVWATVEQPMNATNTVYLSLGGTAKAGAGYMLTRATSTNPVPLVTFGSGTSKYFTGNVTAITNTGSSTVLVTSCK